MPITSSIKPNPPGPAYAVMRHGGASPAVITRQLGLDPSVTARLEAVFQDRARRGEEPMPRFAHHAAHVAAVKAAGGYPVLPPLRGRRP